MGRRVNLMTRLQWNIPEEQIWESGLDRGVLYVEDAPGVVWNGLTSVTTGFLDGELESLYRDGDVYFQNPGARTFEATLSAISAPAEFSSCLGNKSPRPGFVLTRQAKSRFGLTWRTRVTGGYKIHLLYNTIATLSGTNRATMNSEETPMLYEVSLSSTPFIDGAWRPSPHFTIDSRRYDHSTLFVLESALYGTNETEPYLPPPSDLI